MVVMCKRAVAFNKLSNDASAKVINCMMFEYRQRATQATKDAQRKPLPLETLPDIPKEIVAHKNAERSASLDRLAASDNKLAQLLAATVRERDHAISIREMPVKAVCNTCGELGAVTYDSSLTPTCVDKLACQARRNTPVTPVCPNGTYTVVLNETGDYRTIKLSDAPEHFNKPVGTQIASYLSGGDNEANYTGCAFVVGKAVYFWTKFRGKSGGNTQLQAAVLLLISADRSKQITLGEAYTIESGKCWHCNRKLTVPASLHRGLGPTCAAKLGVS